MTAHVLGYPRIGDQRQLKWALESYWKGNLSEDGLQQQAKALRFQHWQDQQDAGLDWVCVGDFAFYDQVLNTTLMLGALAPRFASGHELDNQFCAARGGDVNGKQVRPYSMTKWFDTNYHYLVPELSVEQEFELSGQQLFDEVREAQAAGFKPRPTLLGPLTYLWVSKVEGEDKLALLDRLLPVYTQILDKLAKLGCDWVQIDEPALVLDLPQAWKQAYENAYNNLQGQSINVMLATYFGGLEDNLQLACRLPVAALHVDLVRAPEQLTSVLDVLPAYKILSVGVVNGRNVWRNNIKASLEFLATAHQRLGQRLWIGTSCSLLHSPVDLNQEQELTDQVKGWLAFSKQKLQEVKLLSRALREGPLVADISAAIFSSQQAFKTRSDSAWVHQQDVQQRIEDIKPSDFQRHSAYGQRIKQQAELLKLPLLPTTTIGSFPQTAEIRNARQAFRQGLLTADQYQESIQQEIRFCIQQQEQLGLDVLVHGEAERNDMVEYFGQQLSGFVFSQYGWVQSYGSRCVKPPIIVGDISRKQAMTVDWAVYAQAQSKKPVKGMLTGPVTILGWSFEREDIGLKQQCFQIALALRDEVLDLQAAGINIVQVDEAAFREGLPLRIQSHADYLAWAVDSFRLTVAGAKDTTQIHTHMCYSDFNAILDSIAKMDADVISIETSRADKQLFGAFSAFTYPNDIGPGVYDIHSPLIPECDEIQQLISQAIEYVPAHQLWINPDCGLKTRQWDEVIPALKNMVTATQKVRENLELAAV